MKYSGPPNTCSTYPTIRLAAHRLDDASGLLCALAPMRSEAWTGKVAKQRPYCSWAPWESSRSAGVWGRVRSTLRQLTSRGCLSAAPAGREASSARGPKHRAPQSSPARAGPPPSGPPFFGDFLSGKRKFAQRGFAHFAQRSYANTKVTALSGAHPDAASRSEKPSRKSRTRLRYLSLNGWWWHASKGFDKLSPNGGGARNGWGACESSFDKLSPNGEDRTESARTE